MSQAVRCTKQPAGGARGGGAIFSCTSSSSQEGAPFFNSRKDTAYASGGLGEAKVAGARDRFAMFRCIVTDFSSCICGNKM